MPSRSALFVSLLLSACSYEWKSADTDGDGFSVEDGDCWDAPEGPAGSGLTGDQIHPDATETWYDGVDQDCDGTDDYDQDADGYWVTDDCDDQAATTYPGASDDWYDGVDANCDDANDYDQDGDGEDAQGYETGGGDCDDLDPTVNTSATETWYDGVDQDCAGDDDYDQDADGFILSEDCDDTDASKYPDYSIEEIWYNGLDENCDGNDGDQDGDGYVEAGYAYDWTQYNAHEGEGDCWDDPDETPAEYVPIEGYEALSAEQVSPLADETWYDGVDQDCDAASDFDQDGDGFDSAYEPGRDGAFGDDCIDGSARDEDNPAGLSPYDVNPDAVETWYDGTDQDCVGDDDYDQDMDGYQAEGFGVGSDDDCDDNLDAVNPSETEDCETDYDDNCDDDTNDDGAIGCELYYVDADSDGYGSDDSACLCEPTTTYEDVTAGDCDDASASDYPGATEVTGNEDDENCDGKEKCYVDADDDGYRMTTTVTGADTDCDDAGEATSGEPTGECDDDDEDINPDATEIAGDEVDQDCDDQELCYVDADNDGYRLTTTVASTSDTDCDDSGEALSSDSTGDCDDTDSGIRPGATEITGDEIDQNCDGQEKCYVDADNDGFRMTTTVTGDDETCDDSGEATSGEPTGECDDTDPDINPGATEIVGDEVDQDCDDEELCYADGDNDGYRTDETVISSNESCGQSGEATASDPDDDCEDDVSAVFPDASEVCEDGYVNDCAGTEEDALVACGWTSAYDVTAAWSRKYGEAASDLAGANVAFATDLNGDGNDEVVIAATGASSSSGSVYVLNGMLANNNTSLSSTTREYTSEGTGDQLGTGLAGGVDLDGDGYRELILGAPYLNNAGGAGGASDWGAAYLIEGPLPASGALSSSIYAARLIGGAVSDYAGYAVAGVENVDGDGNDAVLIGAPRVDASATNSGAAYLLYGPVTSMALTSTSADGYWTGTYASDRAGTRLASAGDVNGDGATDFLVGAMEARVVSSGDLRGKVYLFLGPATGTGTLSSSADRELRGAADDDYAGSALAGGADVDGDGTDDLLIGASGADGGGTDSGVAYLVLGSSSIPTSSLTLSGADAVLSGVAASDEAGASVALFDINDDGFGDLVVGAPAYSGEGGAFLFFGPVSASASLSAADVIFAGQSTGDTFGETLAAGGDHDEDGYQDLLIGAPTRSPTGLSSAGMVYLFNGTGY